MFRHLSSVSLLLTLGLYASTVDAQSANPCDHPKRLPPEFFEVPPGPKGDWRATVSPDTHQADDPLLPVVVSGAGAIQGPANRRGMRLGCGVLKNRSGKSVIAVSLRWTFVRNQDRAAILQNGYTSDTVVLEGHTESISLTIPETSVRRTDFSIINFAAVTAPLTRNGMLSGDYFLYVGVYEVRFGDGSVWKSGPLVR
ncbi:MAG TPA: hypothetical protein VF074_18635 [Pyrinomonadaceae bacterium]